MRSQNIIEVKPPDPLNAVIPVSPPLCTKYEGCVTVTCGVVFQALLYQPVCILGVTALVLAGVQPAISKFLILTCGSSIGKVYTLCLYANMRFKLFLPSSISRISYSKFLCVSVGGLSTAVFAVGIGSVVKNSTCMFR